jgi:MerR family transcriptional regulator, copper efflux regulator
MLISEFARAAGLSRDTVRFYVRLGLLQPQLTLKGGRRPYQVFAASDVQTAQIIRVAQSLGMSLKEIAGIAKQRREGRITRQRSAEILRDQLAILERKSVELSALTAYLRAKIEWLDKDEAGSSADFQEFLALAPSTSRRDPRQP